LQKEKYDDTLRACESQNWDSDIDFDAAVAECSAPAALPELTGNLIVPGARK